jgi:hypothetical protein
MNCPSCKESLEGGLIYEHFLAEYKNEDKALMTARLYGATKTEGRWGLATGIYSMEEDRTVAWRCPFCQHQWGR